MVFRMAGLERRRSVGWVARVVIGSLIVLSLIPNVRNVIDVISGLTLDSYELSDFLVNFQGGFVRRGLFGEILFQLYRLFDLPLKGILSVLGCGAFAFALFFFIRKFRQHGYSWWLLCSPLFLNFPWNILRKDYILYAILILVLYLLRRDSQDSGKRLWACLVLCLGLFLHEAFIFFGFPLYALLLLRERNNRVSGRILVLVPVIIFMVLCAFKGDERTAGTITASWNALRPEPMLINTENSIGAIGWELWTTVKFHLRVNSGEGYSGIFLIPLIASLAYYMFTNFIFVFKGRASSGAESKLSISLLYSLALICLIPMMTVLSCDIGRVFQYATVAAFSGFLIIAPSRVVAAFPAWYGNMIARLNEIIMRYMPPGKGTMILLLFLLAVSPCCFSLFGCWQSSIMANLSDVALKAVAFLKHLILP